MDKKQPLAILTRPAGRNTVVLNGLLRRGWAVLECPALEIQDLVTTALDIPRPDNFDLVVFVSRAAVAGYYAQLGGEASLPWPSQTIVACMGPATAHAIKKTFGDSFQLVHPDGNDAQDSEALWPRLQALEQPLNRVLIVRGQDGRDWLNLRLREHNIEVTLHQAYHRQRVDWTRSLVDKLTSVKESAQPTTWLLTSAHGVEALALQMQKFDLLAWFATCHFVLTHERLKPVLSHWLACSGDAITSVVACPEDAAILASFEQIQAP